MIYTQSDLVYPYSLVLFGNGPDYETYGLFKQYKSKMVEMVYKKLCTDCEASRLKTHGLTRSDWITSEI